MPLFAKVKLGKNLLHGLINTFAALGEKWTVKECNMFARNTRKLTYVYLALLLVSYWLRDFLLRIFHSRTINKYMPEDTHPTGI